MYSVRTMRLFVIFIIALIVSVNTAVAEDHACDLAKTAIKEASTIRRLSQKKKVPCILRDKESVKKHLLEMVSSKIPPEKMELEGYVYKVLGFLPEDFNYSQGLIDLYVSQLGGYYDPEHQYFVMAGWIPPLLQSPIAVHELTHALQDQYYNLETFMDTKLESSDILLARSALVEGDATLVMLDFARKIAGQGPLQSENNVESIMLQNVIGGALTASMSNVPQSLQLTLLFPYTSGLRFSHTLLRRKGYASIDDAFRRPPRSTEEILHPEKYDDLKPDFIAFTDKDVDGDDKAIYHDTYGEFLISALLGMTSMDKLKVSKAAAGWGGDRMCVIETNGKRKVRWILNWDTEQDAQEFIDLYEPALKNKYPKGEAVISHDGKRIRIEVQR